MLDSRVRGTVVKHLDVWRENDGTKDHGLQVHPQDLISSG
jgi:hypothetical protein